MASHEAPEIRITRLETKVDNVEGDIGDLSESIKWLTRAIFGLMGTLLIGIFAAILTFVLTL